MTNKPDKRYLSKPGKAFRGGKGTHEGRRTAVHQRGLLGLLLAIGITAGATGCVTISPITATGDFPVANRANLANSPTFQRMIARDQDRGRIIIGVKDDQPGLGYYDEATKTYTGFDVEIAELIAAKLGFTRDELQFVPVESASRETALQNSSVDLVVASYSYTAQRAQLVGFAGPYLETPEALMVRSDEAKITSMGSLNNGNQVCSTSGSNSYDQISSLSSAQPVSRNTFSECVSALKQHSLDGVFTDQAVLAGYVTQDPQHLKLLDVPNSGKPQLYGVGLQFGDDSLRERIDEILKAAEKDGTWQAIFNATLAPSGIKPVTPTDGTWSTP
jgi:glutamate transport system substrate-binding protein